MMFRKVLSLAAVMVMGMSTTSFAAEPAITENTGELNNDGFTAYGEIAAGCNDITPFPTVEQQLAEFRARNIPDANQEEAIAKCWTMVPAA